MRNPEPYQRLDRNHQRDFSPLQVGKHTVRRTPLRGTPYTVYSTLHGGAVAGRQLSYPSQDDCAKHVAQHLTCSRRAPDLAALLDTALHARIVEALRLREMDARDLCSRFDLRITSMRPLLALLVSENRIVRRGTARRPIYSSHVL
ncbi:hypothetical protein ASC94_09110 [Massilia sp. Root418]|uniref:hypothetical protein n=1 Tax=Massilia sp. Root418 TaxID=1736532 RepID=UPI0006FD7EEE|nr:hypothetical protein [Massilia sp. Root418]KQW96956.1 hypothetical protein ASC94_09110 [Massilia sp. Root418]